MKSYKWVAIVAAAVGYVLGAKAGRTRYEEIRRTAQRVMGDPRVRDVAHQAQEQVAHAADKVRHGGHSDDTSGTGVPPTQSRVPGDAMMGR